MRKRTSSGGVTVEAIAGNHAIFFGLDLEEGVRDGCLGFSVHRVDHDPAKPEQYWLSGFKTFRSVVPQPDPKAFYSTRDHPLQTFYWSDYTAKPGHSYTYRFVPRYGQPKNLQDRDGVEATIDVSTSDPDKGTHGIYFNRGVAASQAYENKFDLPPDKLPPDRRARALEWLSRGRAEAILAFIGQAKSDRHALRAAVYEFTQPEVLDAFKQAHDRGVDVQIVYEAKPGDQAELNRKAIAKAKLPKAILTKRTKANIAHNKFIVFGTKDAAGNLAPASVWTGSTNFSEGGIFGHSNVGHVVRDGTVAARYFDFWSELAQDPQLDELRDWCTANSAFDPATVAADGIATVFSPRHGLAPLEWYSQEFAGAATAGHVTEAFGMTKIFEDDLKPHADDALHYVMLDQPDNHQDQWAVSAKVLVAVGAIGGPSELGRWAQEQLTGFNSFVPYLHTKIVLRDPLSAAPTTISGSANFSPNSTSANDENMLVIPGDREVADVYFTEYARIFNHFYARYWASQLHAADAATRSFLDETDAWQTPYFADGNPKQLQRTLYSSEVDGNEPV
jgi:phosphatidylserine/phosphatidylglycerophosphate/cardiolipin synthase-like enzyme